MKIIFRFALSLIFMALFVNGVLGETSKGHIVIGTTEAMPLSGITMVNGGFYPELIKALFQRVGYTTEIKFYPFLRLMVMLKTGTIAGAATVSFRDERTRFLYYPDELYAIKLKVFGTKNGELLDKFTSLTDLKGYKVGTLRGSFIEKELVKYGIEFDPVSSFEQNLSKVLNKRVDFILGPEIIIRYILKNNFSVSEQNMIITYDPPYKIDKHYVAFSKKYPGAQNLVKAFNLGLQLIKDDGTYDKINARYMISTGNE